MMLTKPMLTPSIRKSLAELEIQSASVERRRHLRLYPDNLRATLFARGQKREVKVENLSLSGARVASQRGEPLTTGEFVAIRLPLGGYGAVLIACQVRNVAGNVYGISFDSLDAEETDTVSFYLYDLLKRGKNT